MICIARQPLFLAIACSLTLVVAPLRAQDAPPPPPRPPHPGPPRAEAGGERSIPLGELLTEYGRIIGKKVLHDSSVNLGTTIDPPETDGPGGRPKPDLIAQTLSLNGYSLIDTADDVVTVLGPGKNARAFGVPLYTRPEELPHEERVFSYLYKCQHRDPAEVATFLQQYIPPSNDVNFVVDRPSRTIIATCPTTVMRGVFKAVAVLDQPSEPAH